MSVVRNISSTMVTRILLTLFTVAQSVFVTRLLGAEGRGLYAKLQVGQNFFILFLGLGLTSGVSYFIANRKFAAEKVMGLSFWVWLLNVLALAMFLVASAQWPGLDFIFPAGYALNFFRIYLFVCFALNSWHLFLNAALSGRQNFSAINKIELWSIILRAAVFASLLGGTHFAVFHASPTIVFTIDIVLTLLRTLAFQIAYFKDFGARIHLRIPWHDLTRPMLGFSILVYFSFLLNFFYLRLDFWLIEHGLGLKDLGIYSVATGLAQYITFIPVTLSAVMMPHLSAHEPEDRIQHFKMFSRLNIVSCGLLTLLLAVLAAPLLRALYGQPFLEAALPLRILALSFFLLSVKHLYSFYNITQKHTDRNIWAEVVGLVVGVTLNLWLIPRIGMPGAAIASLGANFTSCLYLTTGVLWSRGAQLREFFLFSRGDLTSIYLSLFPARNQESL